MNKLKRIKAVAFDLDGTIYLGERLLPGAHRLIGWLGSAGVKVRYFTNNSTRTRQEIAAKLGKLGIKADLSQVYTSALAAALFISQKGIKRVFCVGSAGLRRELAAEGIKVTDGENGVEAIVIGLDKGFNYELLSRSLAVLFKFRCPIIACNRDPNYPVGQGRFLPGCGPIVAAIENASGRRADHIVGKPSTYLMEYLAGEAGVKRNEVMVVGDSYDSDIKMAQAYGAPALLVSKRAKRYPRTGRVNSLFEIKRLLSGVAG